MDREIISHETRQAFARVGAKLMGGGFGLNYFFLRPEMAKAGINTTEKMQTTAAGETESLPLVDQFQGYYETINWQCRDDVRRMVPVFEKIILTIVDLADQSFIQDISQHLDVDGLRISSRGKICLKKPLET